MPFNYSSVLLKLKNTYCFQAGRKDGQMDYLALAYGFGGCMI